MGGGFQPCIIAMLKEGSCKHCSNTEILPEPQRSPGFLPGIELTCSPLPSSQLPGARRSQNTACPQTCRQHPAGRHDSVTPLLQRCPSPAWCGATGNTKRYKVESEDGNSVRRTIILEIKDIKDCSLGLGRVCLPPRLKDRILYQTPSLTGSKAQLKYVLLQTASL